MSLVFHDPVLEARVEGCIRYATVMPPARVLPPDAARLLQGAARTPLNAGRYEAIDAAIRRAKCEFPDYFK